MKKYIIGLGLILSSVSFSEVDIKSEPAFPLQLSSNGTYLQADPSDSIGPPVRLELTPPARDVKPGDVIKVTAQGFLKPGEPYAESFQTIGAVFVGPGGFISPFGLKRTNVSPIFSPITCFDTENKIATDIPQDFQVPGGGYISEGELLGAGEVEVPEGATAILFGVVDCYYKDNSDPNFDFGSLVQIQIIKSKYKLEKKMYDGDNLLGNASEERIVPSGVYKTNANSTTRQIKIRCLDEEDKPQEDCKLNLRLQLKEGEENDGGHGHSTFGRPYGKITIDGVEKKVVYEYLIKKEGTTIIYESPTVSGVVELKFKVYDKDKDEIKEGVTDTTFTVRINEDLVPISNAGIITQASSDFIGPVQSHPNDGFYLKPSSLQRLYLILERYSRSISEDNIPFIPLRSTAASLKWGGLYDINKDWRPSHKEHRDGTDIDLSTHTIFGKIPTGEKLRAQNALQKAITMSTLGHPVSFPFPRSIENPNTDDDHWHVYLEQVRD